MGVRQGTVASVPVTLLRIGFTGELGYEIHAPAGYGLYLWETLMDAGRPFDITPFGVEAQRIMRLEKGHFIVGQDTDGLTDPLMVNLAWYQRLPADLREIFDDVAREAMEYSDALYATAEHEIIATLGKTVEIIHPTPAVRAQMKARTQTVYEFFVERGDYTWDDINAAIAASRGCGQE